MIYTKMKTTNEITETFDLSGIELPQQQQHHIIDVSDMGNEIQPD